MAEIEIGRGKSGRRAYGFDEIAIVPSRRTRDRADVDVGWQIDAYRFDLPIVAAAMDGVTSPSTAISMGRLGGLGVLDAEGLWSRHDDPEPLLAEVAELDPAAGSERLRDLYTAPVRPELLADRIREIKSAGARAAVRVRPQMAEQLTPHAVGAEVDLLAIQGLVVSAEHVSSASDPLNLKTYIRRLEVPVVVGGCVSYQAALHLMRTGAAGVLVGAGSGRVGTSSQVLGFGTPNATAIADARAARMRHLDETGVYCQVIADGGMRTSGDVAKAIVCGADAVMMGMPLAAATDGPAPGRHWDLSIGHASLPRSRVLAVEPTTTLERVLVGPAADASGTTNIVGALRSSMAMCGYTDVKDFQKADLVVGPVGPRRRGPRQSSGVRS